MKKKFIERTARTAKSDSPVMLGTGDCSELPLPAHPSLSHQLIRHQVQMRTPYNHPIEWCAHAQRIKMNYVLN